MIRSLFLAVVFGMFGLLFGWFAFGQVLGKQLPPEYMRTVLFGQPQGMLQSFAYNLAGFQEMRQKLLICSAIGIGVSALIGALLGRRKPSVIYIQGTYEPEEQEQESEIPFRHQRVAAGRSATLQQMPRISALSTPQLVVLVIAGVILVMLIARAH